MDLLFPPKCSFCGKVLDEPGICPSCERELPRTSGREALWEEGSLRCAAPLWYEGIARDGLLRFKFEGAPGAAVGIGPLMAQCAAEELGGQFDIVTWVPISRKRLRRRGYDQSRLLAKQMCRSWDTKPMALLKKIGDNPAQSGMHDAAARRANVLGMYRIIDEARVTGKRILLVDDICTTGSTLSECARELRLAGAESVVCVAAARTHSHKK